MTFGAVSYGSWNLNLPAFMNGIGIEARSVPLRLGIGHETDQG